MSIIACCQRLFAIFLSGINGQSYSRDPPSLFWGTSGLLQSQYQQRKIKLTASASAVLL